MKIPDRVFIRPEAFKIPWSANIDENSDYGGIEYSRTDTFIEKTCAFLNDRIDHDSIDYPMATKHLINDYIKYMKK